MGEGEDRGEDGREGRRGWRRCFQKERRAKEDRIEDRMEERIVERLGGERTGEDGTMCHVTAFGFVDPIRSFLYVILLIKTNLRRTIIGRRRNPAPP